MYYFAYGSNMNHKQMEKRCKKRSKFIGKAYLTGYSFKYMKRNTNGVCVANIIEETGNPKHIVWGGLYEIDENCLSELDKYEGYGSVYGRKLVEVVWVKNSGSEEVCEAWIYYLLNPGGECEPLKDYEKRVVDGAKDCGLPRDYIEKNLRKRKFSWKCLLEWIGMSYKVIFKKSR